MYFCRFSQTTFNLFAIGIGDKCLVFDCIWLPLYALRHFLMQSSPALHLLKDKINLVWQSYPSVSLHCTAFLFCISLFFFCSYAAMQKDSEDLKRSPYPSLCPKERSYIPKYITSLLEVNNLFFWFRNKTFFFLPLIYKIE